jgi:hypothetical protein
MTAAIVILRIVDGAVHLTGWGLFFIVLLVFAR